MENKSREMVDALDQISLSCFGRSRSESMKAAVCVTCGAPSVSFKNDLSRKEYTISGMCQACQDKTYDAGEEY